MAKANSTPEKGTREALASIVTAALDGMSNVICLTTRKPFTTAPTEAHASRKSAPAPTQQPFSIDDGREPLNLEPGIKRNFALNSELVLAQFHVSPTSPLPRDPHKALRETRRALAILEVECFELDRAKNGGAS